MTLLFRLRFFLRILEKISSVRQKRYCLISEPSITQYLISCCLCISNRLFLSVFPCLSQVHKKYNFSFQLYSFENISEIVTVQPCILLPACHGQEAYGIRLMKISGKKRLRKQGFDAFLPEIFAWLNGYQKFNCSIFRKYRIQKSIQEKPILSHTLCSIASPAPPVQSPPLYSPPQNAQSHPLSCQPRHCAVQWPLLQSQ